MRNRRLHRPARGRRRSCSTGCAGWSTAATTAPGMATGDRRPSCTCARRPAGIADLAKLVADAAGPGLPRHQPHPLGDARRRPPTATPTRTSAATAPSPSSTTASSRTTPPSSGSSRPTASSFRSDTDTEVIAHLIAHHFDGDLVDGRAAGAAAAQGHLRPGRRQPAASPGVIVGARLGSPLVARHRRRRALPGQRPGRPGRPHASRSSTCRTASCAC